MSEHTAERWLPVVGFEGKYEVSDQGRVRSFLRSGRILKTGGSKYPQVTLGRGNHRRVHQLVAAAFIGACPPGMEVLHANDVGTDNRVENLSYGTRSRNGLDQVVNGRHGNARLTHCYQNHPFDEENTNVYQGARRCRACIRAYGIERRRLARAAA